MSSSSSVVISGHQLLWNQFSSNLRGFASSFASRPRWQKLPLRRESIF
jgi:hypothetical protein